MRQRGIGDSASADVSVQNYDVAGRKLVSQNSAVIPHAGGDLHSLGAWCCYIYNSLRMIIICKQRRTGSIELDPESFVDHGIGVSDQP